MIRRNTCYLLIIEAEMCVQYLIPTSTEDKKEELFS